MLIPKIHKIEYNFFQIFKTFTFEAMTQDRKQGPFCFYSGEIGLRSILSAWDEGKRKTCDALKLKIMCVGSTPRLRILYVGLIQAGRLRQFE